MTDPLPAEVTRGLLGDDPVDDESHDLLQRTEFVTRVRELIDHVAQETPSAVLALLGPWGSGKTSVLHFVRRRLESHGLWRVVEFNPWMVSDLSSLVQNFFTTLVAALPEDRNGKKLRRKVTGYAKAVSPLAEPFNLFGINAGQVVRTAGDVLATDESIEARRRDLEEALRAHDKPVLVILDDLDRLQPDELRLVFKLVRLVGRLPNVYYLLAFDEKTVLDVLMPTELADRDHSRAVTYLEKMVQVRLDLPPAHPRLAGQLLDQLLDALIAKHGVELDGSAEHRLSHAYQTHLSTYLREPRQVKRYCAQIEALYPLVASEVDFADFAIITFLRTFYPGLVSLLAAHRAELTGTAVELPNKPSYEQRRDTWRERLSRTGVSEADLDGIMELLGQLFLPIKSALERVQYGSGFYPELASARRVGSAEYFDRYFHLGIGPDDLPDATAVAAVTEVVEGSPGKAWSTVVGLLSTNAELVLEKLRRLAPKTSEAALRLVPVLASIADEVPEGGFIRRPRIVHHLWVADLLLLSEPADPQAFAAEVTRAGGVRFLAESCAQAKRSLQTEEHATTAAFDALCRETVRLIQEDLQRQAALRPEDTSGVRSLLADWGALDPNADGQTWLRSVIESGAWPMPDALGLFVPVGTSSMGGGVTWPSLGDTELELLDRVVGLEYVVEGLESLPEPSEESVSGRSDVSWEARVRRAQRDVARWARSKRPNHEPTSEPDNGTGAVDSTP